MAAKLDDPHVINTFLRAIHGPPVEKKADVQASSLTPSPNPELPDLQKDKDSDSGNGIRVSDENSPPPPLPSVPMDALTLESPNVPAKASSSPAVRLTPTQERLLRKKDSGALTQDLPVPSFLTMKEQASDYMDKVIQQHLLLHGPLPAFDPARNFSTKVEYGGRTFEDSGSTTLQYANLSSSSPPSSERIHYVETASPVVDEVAKQASSGAIAMSPTPGQTNIANITDMQSPTVLVNTSDLAADKDDGGNEQGGKDEESGLATEDDEDREHLTHFKSWGTPAKRNRPSSRVRTVVLTGLPGTAGFTFVQSLIYGGSIETMRLLPGKVVNSRATAFVTFTDGDACDRYVDKGRNGMKVSYEGKWFDISVKKTTSVDVMSGMMQGYLDCGASRVVKAIGADDDWGIVALNKLAEGMNKIRQVESVTDSLHNGVRTVLFRFANISDAVKFKGYLIRDYDWEGCRIEFAEDPCAKAVKVHDD